MAVPTVSFVVLNWHAAAATRDCVRSVHAQQGAPPFEVIVVDNESTPDTRRELGDGPWRLVCLDGNRGFTGGMNAGAAHARGEFLALLNNDARLAGDWLARALHAAADPEVAVVGGRSLADGPGSSTTLPRIDPRGFSQLLAVETAAGAVATVDGGHLLVRAAAWRQLGGLDDDFFAYYEEHDLCARALARGWRVVYDPEVRVWHRRGLSSDRVAWRRLYWARRNRAIWLAKHFPAGEWRQAVGAAALEYLAVTARGPGGLELRSASLAAAAWVLSHGRWLGAKRRRTLARGEHDPAYRARLRELYEPPPFAPALLVGRGARAT